MSEQTGASTLTLSPERSPCVEGLEHAAKLAISEDRPVLFDYWSGSVAGDILVGVRSENGEKLLVKNAEEYTSPIKEIYRAGTDLVVVTENSIYLIADNVQTRKIS